MRKLPVIAHEKTQFDHKNPPTRVHEFSRSQIITNLGIVYLLSRHHLVDASRNGLFLPEKSGHCKGPHAFSRKPYLIPHQRGFTLAILRQTCPFDESLRKVELSTNNFDFQITQLYYQ